MTVDATSLEGRRAHSPQAPLSREVARPRLTDALHDRFGRPLITLVAGAGFGKTTALAQALRANLTSPRGIDVWVSCETADEDGRRLATAIVQALAPGASVNDPLDSVIREIRRHAPIDVCIVLDDVHEIPTDSTGHHLISDLVNELPPHGHLVLSSRVAIPLALARRRAAGQVVDITASELAFRTNEIAALAQLHGGGVPQNADLAGWPSLVALTISARRDAANEFLWEEIVAGLSPSERRAFLAMTTLGWGTACDVAFVASDEARPDDAALEVARLVKTVPLVSGDIEDRSFVVHQLWEEAARRIFDTDEVDAVRGRALELMARRGEVLRLGAAAIRWNNVDGLRLAALALVGSSLGALPIETARRWLAAAGSEERRRPELRLLALAVSQAQPHGRIDIDAEVDELIDEFGTRDDDSASAEAIAFAAIEAHGRSDLTRLLSLAERARSMKNCDSVPTLQFLCGAIDASLATLRGDANEALRICNTLPFDQVPAQVSEIVTRLRCNMLVLVGRVDLAQTAASCLIESVDPHVRAMPSIFRWLAGDPSDFVANMPGLDDVPSLNVRDRFIRTASLSTVASSMGRRSMARAARAELASYLATRPDARDTSIAAIATACTYVLDHDETAAVAAIGRHLEQNLLDDPLGELHLRRNVAITYVLDPDARKHWDNVQLGVHQQRVRAVARRFCEARQGELDANTELPEPGLVFTSLPLPWSVELAVAACRAGVPGGQTLLRSLADWTLAATRRELDHLTALDDQGLAREAADLLADLPLESGSALQIDVLGAMRLSVDDQVLERPELRRGVVRTVLALLIVRGPLRRDQLIDIVWPDADLDSGRQNLRTTLSRLRRLLEPGDTTAEYASRLRTEGDLISLAGPPCVDVDLWQFRRLMESCDEPGVALDAGLISVLGEAVALWRGHPLLDLESVVGLDADLQRIGSDLIDSCLHLGEQLVAVGRFAAALECVERCRLAAPYSERAQRLAIAALLQLHDRDRLFLQVRSLRAMLDDLGVEPEPATAMLLSRAQEQLGRTLTSDGVHQGLDT